MRRALHIGYASRIAALVLSMAALPASAAEIWQSLPPTPQLPRGTIARYVEVGGARIWYAEWGPRTKAIPVLLLHGGFANSNYFGNLIPALADHGYRVIAMDSRGHGRSTRSDAPYSYHLMAEDVIGLLNVLGIARIKVVGWSDGGIIGLDLALNHPDRLAGLFAFGASADVSAANEGFDKSPVFAAYLGRVPGEYRSLSPTPDQWDSFSAAVGRMWDTQPAFGADQLRSLKVPIVIADGEYDEAIRPEHTRYMASTIPGARLLILPRVSHFAMLQNPRAFDAAVLEFLRER
ncbi:MAG: alpha/beta hydrolase [Steroidobacteraceae bacterium]